MHKTLRSRPGKIFYLAISSLFANQGVFAQTTISCSCERPTEEYVIAEEIIVPEGTRPPTHVGEFEVEYEKGSGSTRPKITCNWEMGGGGEYYRVVYKLGSGDRWDSGTTQKWNSQTQQWENGRLGRGYSKPSKTDVDKVCDPDEVRLENIWPDLKNKLENEVVCNCPIRDGQGYVCIEALAQEMHCERIIDEVRVKSDTSKISFKTETHGNRPFGVTIVTMTKPCFGSCKVESTPVTGTDDFDAVAPKNPDEGGTQTQTQDPNSLPLEPH